MNKMKKIIYLNKPLEDELFDIVGMKAYTDAIESAISSNVKMIAVTSTFGGGKSSVISLVEKRLRKCIWGLYRFKFCRVNLWSQEDSSVVALHRNFVYQVSSQINPTRGSYISRRLNENFDLISLETVSKWLKLRVLLLISILIFGLNFEKYSIEILAFLPFLTAIEKYMPLYTIIIPFLILIYTLLSGGFLFSYKRGGDKRTIDENEIIDVYNSLVVRKGFLKHYIIVIEDLDRTSEDITRKFLKELRKYYFIEGNETIFSYLRNRVTFIINLKPEVVSLLEHNAEKSQDYLPIYSKLFDYIINLRKINIDNYDSVLDELVKQKEEQLQNLGVCVYRENNIVKIKGIQWLIQGKNLSIREIKDRLNAALLLYGSLVEKFGNNKIEFEKCVIVTYLQNEYANDFEKMEDKDLDTLIEKCIFKGIEDVKNEKISHFVSEPCFFEILYFIEKKLIDGDYRTYFYNYPKGSKLYTIEQNKLINSIVFDEFNYHEIKELLLKRDTGPYLIKIGLNKYYRLRGEMPSITYYFEKIFNEAFEIDRNQTIDSLLKYVNENRSIPDKQKPFITNFLVYTQHLNLLSEETIDMIVIKINEVIKEDVSLYGIRSAIITTINDESLIVKFRRLFISPILTYDEIGALSNIRVLISLIDPKSTDFSIDFITRVHNHIIKNYDMKFLDIMSPFYEEIGVRFPIKETKSVMLEYTQISGQLVKSFESEFFKETMIEASLQSEYVKYLNLIDSSMINEGILVHIQDLKIYDGLNDGVRKNLLANNYVFEYLLNSKIDIPNLNLNNEPFQSVIQNRAEDINAKNPVCFYEIRKQMLKLNKKNMYSMKFLFSAKLPLPTIDEMSLISDISIVTQMIEESLVDKNNIITIINFFNSKYRFPNESYLIIDKVLSFEKLLAMESYYNIDSYNVRYSLISSVNKHKLQAKFKIILDLTKAKQIIKFMKFNDYIDLELEQTIIVEIVAGTDRTITDNYVDLVCNCKYLSKKSIDFISDLKPFRVYNEKIEGKLFAKKYYHQYLMSKIIRCDSFNMELTHIDILGEVYFELFSSLNYIQVHEIIDRNLDFLKYLMNYEKFVDLIEKRRIVFVKVYQTTMCLVDLKNYSNLFNIEYLKTISGFDSRESAEYAVDYIIRNPDFLSSVEIYDNIYSKLEDSILKSRYTKARNK